jgi:cytochrome P450
MFLTVLVSLATYQRAATADVTLPDGTFIRKGTKIEMATSAIHMDPDQYENPDQFDGLRYYNMRLKDGEENRHLYVSVGKNDLSFGYGRHACPGRYLGHLNIKLIMAEILLNYDLKLPPGQGRPKNNEFEAIVSRIPLHEIALPITHFQC